MDKPENIEQGIIKSIAESDVKSIVSDVAEISLDAFLKDGLAKDIPVFNWLYAGYNIFNTVSDRILGKKILHFLSGVESASKEERQEFITSLDDPKRLHQVGEQLLLMITKYDDYRKAKLLGYFFAALTKNEITIDEFNRIATIIDKVYFNDFGRLNDINTYYSTRIKDIEASIIQNFLSVGLLTEKTELKEKRKVLMFDKDKVELEIRYKKTDISYKFKDVFNKYIEDELK